MPEQASGGVRFSRLSLLACALVLVACQTTNPPSPSPQPPSSSVQPGVSPAASGPVGSAQALIAADLAAGTIDLGTSLTYRTWALFGDERLPERYDGTPSIGRDTALFAEIAEALPNLTAEQRAVLEPFLKRPTDPASAWSAGAGAPTAGTDAALAAFTTAKVTDPCVAPRGWWDVEWSPDENLDHGVVLYACGAKATVRADLQAALDIVKRLWPTMTSPVPGGMGPPIPDTGVPAHEENGKLDVYLVDQLATCRPRGDACEKIEGAAVAITVRETECKVDGYPERGCPSYMLLGRDRLADASLAGDFAHEFFHVLQFSHNGLLHGSWYLDATATWAEWEYVVRAAGWEQRQRDATKDNLWSLFQDYQVRKQSLLRVDPNPESENRWEYEAWMWPLFEAIQTNSGTITETWRALEGAKDLAAADRIIDGGLGFTANFHEFAVWNAQPADYEFGTSTGLEDVSWQSKQNLGGLPRKFHALRANAVVIGLGKKTFDVDIEQLAAQYDSFRITDEKIRQVSIDISSLKNAGTADLDVLAQLESGSSGSADEWRRVAGQDGRATFCRDAETERIAIFEVVISNHDYTRLGDLLPKDNRVTGNYKIEAKDRCDVPLGFEGTFSGSNSGDYSWHGTAKFELMAADDPSYECSLDPSLVEYCYRFVSGDATWTWPAGKGYNACPGGTVSVTLSRAEHDDGIIHLVISSDEDPEAAGTYGGGVIAGGHQGGEGCEAHNTSLIVAWMATGQPAPRFAAGYQLADSYSHTGCGIEGCGTQSWTWDLAPFFGE